MDTSQVDKDPAELSPRARRVGWWVVAAVILLLVLLQYQNPHFLVGMADQLWSCF